MCEKHPSMQQLWTWFDVFKHGAVRDLPRSGRHCLSSRSGWVVGSISLKRKTGTLSITVYGDQYRMMINDFLRPMVKSRAKSAETWFQKMEPHPIISLLRETFGNRIISQNWDFPWSPKYPLQTFFIDRVYVNTLKTLREPKTVTYFQPKPHGTI